MILPTFLVCLIICLQSQYLQYLLNGLTVLYMLAFPEKNENVKVLVLKMTR